MLLIFLSFFACNDKVEDTAEVKDSATTDSGEDTTEEEDTADTGE